MIVEILATVVPIITGFGIFCLRVEHRLTKLETKVDTLLNHNGINPKENKVKKK